MGTVLNLQVVFLKYRVASWSCFLIGPTGLKHSYITRYPKSYFAPGDMVEQRLPAPLAGAFTLSIL